MKKLWQRLDNFYTKYATLIKLIFMLSVLIFVIQQVVKVSHEINGQQAQAVLNSQSPLQLGIMLILGILAVFPMFGYDLGIVRFLPGHYSKGYIMKTSWITNTFTNLMGFGGFLGATLRASFYNREASKKQVIYAISKIALFLIAGLSFLCWVALIMTFGFHIGTVYEHYWFWLVGGALYFPGIFLVTRFNHGDFFKDLTLRREVRLISVSVGEWLACLLFFLYIGFALNLPIHLAAVVPLFVVASVVGVVSLMPGGLGSFDVFMILGLGYIGVSPATAAVWLLLYRIFYYLVPFILGVTLFVHYLGSRVNQFFDGLPKQIFQNCAHGFLTVFMYFSGIMLLLFATIPNVVLSNRIFLQFAPYMFFFINQLTNIVVAFMLIGLARGVHARVKRAYWPTAIVLVIAIGLTLWRENFPLSVAVLLMFVLLCLWWSRKTFYRTHFVYTWGGRIADGLVFAGTFIGYAVIGMYTSQSVLPHHKHLLPQAWLFPSQQVWLMGLIGLFLAVLIVLLILGYFAATPVPFLNQPFDGDRVKRVIDQFGGNEISHLAFTRDKEVYYYTEDGEDQLFFLFKPKADKLIVMGEPVGNMAKVQPALKQFMNDADDADYTLVFYEINEKLTMALHEMGFDFMKAGEDGHVELKSFTLEGKPHRGERALVNKFNREGYTFEVMQQPFSAAVMAELKEVSDEWLGDEVEKGFSLGFFDEQYLNEAPIAVMKDKDGKIIAFANLMPTGNHVVTSIDLMRSSQDAPSGIMDGLFVKLFEYCRDQGYQYFDLGMSPLANVGDSRFSFLPEKMAHLLYEYGYKLYSFQGLRAYKEKYVTKWVSKYTAFRKNRSLVFTTLQILMVVNEPAGKAQRKTIFQRVADGFIPVLARRRTNRR
ncbi:bifunctional lysylphosphatidylglycerol flippase/synthetase MprF [Levilactobacillus bambusae]|uniref:Phosphatidylglycerol lysyltransferase n=1 Tax=Levilactobacillus bambusae TaxID=2024736 RepID=A0A2V1MWX3_9LACO|nr:bifunctional lysylphosphatidylglycerol flippase/synthetase MprF [Levilactobacillus bambusae]PWF99381.1 bifunctional lysylphosphatidylglycerol flippase/synthetase MprF [Levilactobacillus bambusae]